MSSPHRTPPRPRSVLGFLLSITIILSCLVWPNRVPGSSASKAVGLGAARASGNFIDDVDFYVRQHYLDFLTREPDAGGLAFWTNEINSCGADAQCAEVKRINVSAAFFLSIEFQETGYLVYRFYKAAFGNIPGKPVPITNEEFGPDKLLIGQGVRVGIGDWRNELERNKDAFAEAFVKRTRFTSLYPEGMSAAQFVDTLNTNAGGPLSKDKRDALVTALNNGAATRGEVLRAVADDQTLKDAEFRKAFVLMQYFGYLRRNPDDAPDTGFGGFRFWLSKLDQFNGNFIQAEMVKAFISSIEYRDRFAYPSLTAFGNPADPLLLRAVTAKGETVEYFGEKDLFGHPTDLTSVRVTTPDNKVTNILVDEQARPIQLLAFNGVVFKIKWLSNTNIVVSALAPDGSVQVNVPVDLTAPPPAASSCKSCGEYLNEKSGGGAQTGSVNRAPRAGTPAKMVVTPAHAGKKAAQHPAAAAGAGDSIVNVSRCGNAVNDAVVGMAVIPSSAASEAYTVPGNLTGDGQYTVTIPTQPSPAQEAEEICKDITSTLGTACDVVSTVPPGSELLICAQIGAAVSAIATPVVGGAIFTACGVSFAAARVYCAVLGWSPTVGAPSIGEVLCGGISEIVDRYFGGELRLTPIVSIPGEGVIDAGSKTAPSTGPFPSFNVDAGSTPKIASFTTSPEDPAPFQSYIAEALIECAPPGTQVTMSIVGTDGYQDSEVTSIQGDANVTLFVPGAEEGVTDTVTVTISNGPTRKVVLVF